MHIDLYTSTGECIHLTKALKSQAPALSSSMRLILKKAFMSTKGANGHVLARFLIKMHFKGILAPLFNERG